MRLGVVTSCPTNRAVGIISLLLDPLEKSHGESQMEIAVTTK